MSTWSVASFACVPEVSNDALISAAESVLKPYTATGYGGSGRRFGHVGAALVTRAGDLYLGVCIDTGSGTGFYAEHAAVAVIVTAREYVAKVVAVYRDDESGRLFVLPPCESCRQFIRQIDQANLDAEVVLGRSHSARLRDLLTLTAWPELLD